MSSSSELETNKGEGTIEDKLEKFIRDAFTKAGEDPNDKDAKLTKDKCEAFFKNLMTEQGVATAWNPDEFNRIFELFEEDGGDDEGEDGQDDDDEQPSLDRSEFTKLVKRMAAL